MENADFQEMRALLPTARKFIQKMFRNLEPSQSVEDLSNFWAGGPQVMSDWFEWLVGGSKHGSLQTAASEQLVKVLNLVE